MSTHNKINKNVWLIIVAFFAMGFMDLSFAQEKLFEKHELGTVKEAKWMPGEILVKFKEGVSEEAMRSIHEKYGTSVLSISKRGKFRRLRIPRDKTVEEMVDNYRRNPYVEYAEPNFIAYAFMTPNDPYYSYQWHLDNSGYGGIHMQSAWDIQAGGNPNVIVAILDTGVAYENYGAKYKQAPDLANTAFVPGYDFVNKDTHSNDDNGHGTHVTGTIAQSTNNNLGAAGVAYRVSIMPVKILNSAGSGTYTDIADGIYFAADHGAAVINMSLGGTSSSTTLENALAYAHNKGVIIVCAAGNEYQKGNPPEYPAAYDAYCIAVGATRYDETRVYYSNTGSYLDITAPGGDLNVDQNHDGYGDGVLQQTFDKNPANFGYWFYSGTSMATPHVSGVCALLIANGITSPDSITKALEATAKDKGAPGWDPEYGWGIVDAYAALKYSPSSIHDVAVTNISAPSWCVSGDKVYVVVKVINTGNYDETFTVTLSDSTSVLQIGTQTTSLPAKGSVDLTFSWDTAGVLLGDHILKAEAIAVPGESNTSNNTMTTTITVKEAVYDLAVTAIDAPLNAYKGDPVTIFVSVENQGTYPETTTVSLTDTTDNVTIGSQSLSLNAGSSTPVSFNWDTTNASIGIHSFRADVSAVTGETNTANNSMVTSMGTNLKEKLLMHVASIDMTLSARTVGKNKFTKAFASVTIFDPSGVLVQGVTVSGNWSGATSDVDSGITGPDGKVTVVSGEVKNLTPGTTYTFTVNNVTKTSWTYDPSNNVITSNSIRVQ